MTNTNPKLGTVKQLVIKEGTKWGHPLESSGQAGSCVSLIFLFKNQVFLLFKLNLNMTTHLVMTSIGVNMHQSPI